MDIFIKQNPMKNREHIYPAIKTALIFFIIGFTWVLVSDEVIHQIAPNYRIEQRLQTYKSWFFIFGTAILIFFIFQKQLKRVIDYKNRLLISERSLSVVLENIGEGVISTNKLGTITWINKVAENIIGMKMKEVKGKSLFEVLRFFDHKGFDITGMLFNKPESRMDINETVSLKVNKKPGNMQLFVNSDRVYDNTGQHNGNIFAFSDITERKQTEEKILTFKHALDFSTDAIGIATPRGEHYYQNRTFDKMFGDLGNQHPTASLYADEKTGQEVFESIMAGKKWIGEIEMIGKNNEKLDILIRAYPVKNNGKITALVGVHTDISVRKQAMKALKQSEDRLSKIMITAIDGMWDWNLLTNSVYYDPRYYKMAGYQTNEFDHKLEEFQKRVHPSDVNRVMEHARQHLDGEIDRFIEEFRFKKKNGDWLWVSARGEIVEWDKSGKPSRFIGTHTDITDRKLAEAALVASEERFRTFMENSTDASSLYDANLNLIEMNKAGLAMFPKGTKKEDIIGKNLVEIDPGLKDSERYNNYLNVIKTGVPLKIDNHLTHPFWGKKYLSVRLFKVGLGLGMIVTDITKQKQAENAVKESEERYKKIVETTHDLIWSCDVEGNIWYINEACKQIYGYAPEEMIGHNFSKFLTKSQLTDHREKFAKMVNLKMGTFEFDTEIKNKEGKTIYLTDNITVLFENNGKPKGMLGASKNITEKIIAERALHDSMARLELALDGGGLGLWDYSPQSQQLIVSEHWSQMLGLDKKLKINIELFAKLIHPHDLNGVNDAFLECSQNQKKEFNMEFRMKHADGNWKWILSQGKIMERDEKGRALRLVGTNLDITATKHLELKLQRQVKIYSSFIRYASEGIYLFELEKPMPLDLSQDEQINHFYRYGYVETCNDAFAKMYGYQKSEDLVGIKQSKLHGGENVPENIDIMKQFIKSGYRVKEVLSKEVDKEGNNIYISNNVVGIIEDDKLVRTWGSQYNITDRVNAQLELEESEKKYRLLFQTNPVPLIIVDLNELGFLDVNLAVQKLLGFSREEFLHMKLWDIRPDISIFTLGEMKAQILKGAGVQHESKLHTKHDETVLVEVIFDLINYEGQQATLAAFSDITALKDAEKRVLKSIIEGEDNERKRVSIEIHDSLGQNLTAASLNFDSLKQAIQDLKQKDISKFNTGLEFLKSAIDESRNIAHNLMPKAIDDFGLIPSLTSLFNQIEKSTGINVKFYENLSGGRLNRQIELNLYRITQEAINNLIKHSKANEVDIQLLLHKQEIIYTFEDNGIGFDKSSIEITGKGMGLKSIFNRVVTMSGTFDLDSSPERGTSITIEIPI
jgi:PAS domain S-box-containing protein